MALEKLHFKFDKLKLEKLEDKCFLHRIVAKKMGIVYANYKKGWIHHNIKHTQEEFLYVLSGYLQAKIGKKNYLLKKGEGVLIPSGVIHSFVAIKKTNALVIFAPPITSKQATSIMKKSSKI